MTIYENSTNIAPRIYLASSLFHVPVEEKCNHIRQVIWTSDLITADVMLMFITFPHAWWGKVISNAKHIWQFIWRFGKSYEKSTSYIFSVAITFPHACRGKVISNAKHICQFIWICDIICSRSHYFSSCLMRKSDIER
jgi:hypothetical protein